VERLEFVGPIILTESRPLQNGFDMYEGVRGNEDYCCSPKPLLSQEPTPPESAYNTLPTPQKTRGYQPQPHIAPSSTPYGDYPVSNMASTAAAVPPPPYSATHPNVASSLRCRGLFAFTATQSDELSFSIGEELFVVATNGDWWIVQNKAGQQGLIPSNYVELV